MAPILARSQREDYQHVCATAVAMAQAVRELGVPPRPLPTSRPRPPRSPRSRARGPWTPTASSLARSSRSSPRWCPLPSAVARAHGRQVAPPLGLHCRRTPLLRPPRRVDPDEALELGMLFSGFQSRSASIFLRCKHQFLGGIFGEINCQCLY